MNNSSQPFLYINDNNEKNLFYCFGKNLKTLVYGDEYQIRAWKIRHKNYSSDLDVEILTKTYVEGYGDVILECNPHTYSNKLYCTLGFNKGPNEPLEYYLCSYDILNHTGMVVDNLNIIEKTFSGTVYNNQLIYSNPNKNGNLIIKNLSDNTTREIILSTIYLYRVNKIFNEDKFIITGQKENNDFVSYLLDSDFNIMQEITNSAGMSIYKCSLLGNELIYTVKNDFGPNESRSLVEESINR